MPATIAMSNPVIKYKTLRTMKILVAGQTKPMSQRQARHQETTDPSVCVATTWGQVSHPGRANPCTLLVGASAILATIWLVRATPNQRAEKPEPMESPCTPH
jgi:hypothetical protein